MLFLLVAISALRGKAGVIVPRHAVPQWLSGSTA